MSAPNEKRGGARVPLPELPADSAEELERLGGAPINLYRALANSPDMLRAYLELSWALRLKASTPRALRELVILRGSQVVGSEYELNHHLRMARHAGVSEEQMAALESWREADVFSPPERAAIAAGEAVTRGSVDDATAAELARHFDPAEQVELVLTAAFYAMVARVLEAFAVPLEDEHREPPPAPGR